MSTRHIDINIYITRTLSKNYLNTFVKENCKTMQYFLYRPSAENFLHLELKKQQNIISENNEQQIAYKKLNSTCKIYETHCKQSCNQLFFSNKWVHLSLPCKNEDRKKETCLVCFSTNRTLSMRFCLSFT